jgi:hypothetical protein
LTIRKKIMLQNVGSRFLPSSVAELKKSRKRAFGVTPVLPCIIAEWESMGALVAGRPQMIATLDSFRQTLDDLGGGQGVTDAVAGPVVLSAK